MGSIPFEVVIAVVTLVGSAAVTFGAVRAGLNGTRETVRGISTTLNEHVKADISAQLAAAVAIGKLETKIDAFLEREHDRERDEP